MHHGFTRSHCILRAVLAEQYNENKMTSELIIQELIRYRLELSEIMGRFISFPKSYDITPEDDPRLRTIVTEIIDLLDDSFGDNKYSKTIYSTYNVGISNYLQTPSFKSIEDIVSEISSVITRLERNPGFYIKKEKPSKLISDDKPDKEYKDNKRVIDSTDLTVSDLIFSSNYKVKLLVCAVFLAGLGIGVSFGASKLYKEKIIPLVDLYKTQDTIKK